MTLFLPTPFNPPPPIEGEILGDSSGEEGAEDENPTTADDPMIPPPADTTTPAAPVEDSYTVPLPP